MSYVKLDVEGQARAFLRFVLACDLLCGCPVSLKL